LIFGGSVHYPNRTPVRIRIQENLASNIGQHTDYPVRFRVFFSRFSQVQIALGGFLPHPLYNFTITKPVHAVLSDAVEINELIIPESLKG
jgi:hypothetical protein